MGEESKTYTKKSLHIKIIIPFLIVCIVAGIWILKNSQTNTSVESNSDFALNVTEKIDMEQLKSYGVPILIEFGSESCIPCQQMAPIIEELNEELEGKAIIRFVDVNKYPTFAQDYPLSVIPTQLFIDSDGKPYNPKDPEALEMKLYSMKDTNEHAFTTHEGTITKEQLLSILDEMGMEE